MTIVLGQRLRYSVALLILNAGIGRAQQDTTAQGKASTSTPFTYQYAVPESPAFSFLGTTPSKVSRPATPRDFALALANGVDSAGHAQQGVAIDVAPWQLVRASQTTLTDYQRHHGFNPKFLLWNTSLSFGTARASGDSSSTDFAGAIRVTVLNNSDPMLDSNFTNDQRTRQITCNQRYPDPKQSDAAQACQDSSVKQVRQRWLGEHWNASSLILAFAGGLKLVGSEFTRSRGIGYSGWAAYSISIERAAQFIGQVRFDDREPLTRDSALRQSLTYGTRLLIGASTVNLFAELDGVQQLRARINGQQWGGKWSGGIEFKAADQLWLSTGIGSGFARGADSHVVVLGDLRWQVFSGPQFIKSGS